MTNNELLNKIKTEILGIPKYGFEDATVWGDFIDTYFTREGQIGGESYSSELNKTLSSAALSHTLTHIRFSLDQMIEEEGSGSSNPLIKS